MIIEFFGAPGAGKTSGARALAAEFDLPIVLKGGEHRIWDSVVYAVSHPLYSLFFFFTILWQTACTGTWALLRWRLAVVGSTYSVLRGASRFPGIAVVDEGLLQRVLSVYERPITVAYAGRIVRFLNPDYVLFVTSIEREFHRYVDPLHPRCLLGEAYMARWKEVIRHNTRTLREAYEQSGLRRANADAGGAREAIKELISQIS
ncbi:MAG: hypothetical protein KBD16_01990 [Candidatus Pacebacteria bacterium]|nr:hypothetical protein [Candidatus Paceibacterota bacterium]